MSETPDIVERLRSKARDYVVSGGMLDGGRLANDAADEIERLRSALAARTEECARVADEIARKGGDDGWRTGKEIAAAIRALPTEGHSQ